MAYKITQQLVSGMANQGLARSSDIDDTESGKKQSEINEHLMQGEIYDPSADSGKGAWVSNVAESAEIDGKTITTNADGKLSVPIDGKTIMVENNKLSVNVDGTTIQSDAKSGVLSVGVASPDILGGVKTGADTGIVVDEGVIKADFDTTDYSAVGDITECYFPTAKVASPDVVNKIVDAKLNEAIYEVLNTPL